jgi:2-methylcitrate dehydratase PrpD
MGTIAEHIARFILGTRFEDIPQELINRTQAYVTDLLGASLPGISELSSQAVVRTVLAEGGPAKATIFGKGRLVSMSGASLANGTIAHALELDDDHRIGTIHPGAVVIPTALACAEAAGSDGKTFLRAVTVGYEIACRAGESFLGRQYYQGFHPTSTCGVFGAAAASGIILGLNYGQMVNALGIAGTQAFGLGEWRADGSWIKRFHPGRAAQSGILSSLLAREGFTGPATIFEGKDGFLRAFSYKENYDADALLRGLGRDFRMGLTAFKPYPGCRFTHAVIDIGLDLLREQEIQAQEIEQGLVRIYKTDILNYVSRPATPVIAQFSVPYLLATALLHGRVTLDHLTEEAIRDSEVLALADRIQVEEDPAFTKDYPTSYSTEVSLKLRSGEELKGFRDCPRGDPEAPEYVKSPGRFEKEIEDKFRMLLKSTPFATRIGPIITAIKELPTGKSVEPLTDLLGAPPG